MAIERFAGFVESVTEPQHFTVGDRKVEMVTIAIRTIPERQVDASVEDFDDGIVEVSCFSNNARYEAVKNSFKTGHVVAKVERAVINGRIRRNPVAWHYDPAGQGYEPIHELSMKVEEFEP